MILIFALTHPHVHRSPIECSKLMSPLFDLAVYEAERKGQQVHFDEDLEAIKKFINGNCK